LALDGVTRSGANAAKCQIALGLCRTSRAGRSGCLPYFGLAERSHANPDPFNAHHCRNNAIPPA
jgi:hypothetical protein